MTFDIRRLAYVSSSDEKRQHEKRNADIPQEMSFIFKCLAQFVGQQLRATSGKLSKEAIVKLYKAYHDEYFGSVSYSDELRQRFSTELLQLDPIQTEQRLTKILIRLLKNDDKFATFKDDKSFRTTINFMASLGIKLEHWVSIHTGDGFEERQLGNICTPVLPDNAPVLKLLSSQKMPSDSFPMENHGFEYDWEGDSAAEHENTLNDLRELNDKYFQREKRRYLDYIRDAAAQHDRKTEEDSKTRTDRETKGDRETQGDRKTSGEDRKTREDFDSARSAGMGLGGTASSARSSGSNGTRTSGSTSKSFFDNITDFFKSFGSDQLEDEKGNLTLKGLIAWVIGGVAHIIAMVNDFSNSAEAASKAANPGRPLETDEIKDSQDVLFNTFVAKLGKEQEHIRERLTRNWRLAGTPLTTETPVKKAQELEALKSAFLETDNIDAYDALRFEEYLAKIKDTSAKNFIRRQKGDKTQAWHLLQQQLMRDGAYSEVNELLHDKSWNQLNIMSKNVEYQDSDVVDAYRGALDALQIESNSIDKSEPPKPELMLRLCKQKEGILNCITVMESTLAAHNADIEQIEKTLKGLEEQWNRYVKQYQERLASIPKASAESKVQRDKIESEFISTKQTAERMHAEHNAQIKQHTDAKNTLKSQFITYMRGNLSDFAKFPKPPRATNSSSHTDPHSAKPFCFSESAKKSARAEGAGAFAGMEETGSRASTRNNTRHSRR